MTNETNLDARDHAAAARSSIMSRITHSIASKIFGLSIFLLALTIGLSIYLLTEVSRSSVDIAIIARHDLPLAAAIEDLNEYGLRRRLAFARWFGALNRDKPNQEAVAEASANYETFTPKLMAEFTHILEIIDAYPPTETRAVALAEIRAVIVGLQLGYPAITKRQRELIELQKQGRHDEANSLVNVLNDTTRMIQTQRSQLSDKVTQMSARTAAAAEARQLRVRWLTVAATASAVALGLLIAAWVTRRVTRPIRSLSAAVQDVRGGNLEVQLAVESKDEIGTLTDSFNFFVQELRAKEEIKRTFGKYIDPRVLEHMLQTPGAQGSAGEKRVMTVSFGDMVGFSGLSEHLTPSLMVTLLNRHFGLQAQCVQDQLGIVDKYIGDAIMAFWGPPFVKPEEQVLLACIAALKQVASLQILRAELPELTGLRESGFVLDSRIGICTGEVVVGNIGSESSRSYTVIGDTVNVASRLESANRTYGTNILINESTALAVKGQMETREIDTIAVKGRVASVRVFELLGASGSTGNEVMSMRDAYEAALTLYRSRRWSEAAGAFRRCVELYPADRPSRVMLDRCELMVSSPPDQAWDGTWKLQQK
jgi:class 3 adenylate cyclase